MNSDLPLIERASPQELERQARLLTSHQLVKQFLDLVPDMLLVMNVYRQIVFANQRLLSFTGNQRLEDILGRRMGEAFGCIHTREAKHGCGTGEACSNCGAALALLTAQGGHRDSRECRLSTFKQGQREWLDLEVWATPVEIEGESFTFLAITDLSDQKRRRALERIFFHDILNTAGGIKGFAMMLREADPQEVGDISEVILSAADQLLREIEEQKELLAAEKGELSVDPQLLEARDILRQVAEQYRNHPQAEGVEIKLELSPEEVTVVNDPTLLLRVLGNLVKNALEASQPGQVVTLSCRSGDDWVEFSVHNQDYMPRGVQLQVFKRSFSTKGPGRGLGTYSIQLITQRYLKGQVWFNSDPDQGTTFYVRYPRDISQVQEGA